MTLNSLSQQRQDQHDEVEKLVETYKAAGNSISRSIDKVTMSCTVCKRRAYGSIRFATTWGKGCPTCGAKMRMA